MGLILGNGEIKNPRNLLIINQLRGFISGERGIRTPGASQHDGFQDRCNRPLYHLSSARIASKAGAKVQKKLKIKDLR